MTEQSTAVAVQSAEPKAPLRVGGTVSAIVPQDAEQAYRMAALVAKSGMAPRDMQTPEKIVTAIFHGMEVGLKPMQAVQSIAVINGRPCIWGDGALALVMGSGLLQDIEEYEEGEGDDLVAVCRTVRAGRSKPIERRFSVADAKKAGLWGKSGPWQQYPRRMLQMRARSWALRDGFADVLKGMHVVEEVADYRMSGITTEGGDEMRQELVEGAARDAGEEIENELRPGRLLDAPKPAVETKPEPAKEAAADPAPAKPKAAKKAAPKVDPKPEPVQEAKAPEPDPEPEFEDDGMFPAAG